jgi:flavin-dependent dehydrogenase
VVIGGGPGGSVAAKNCARYGMRTLLLEKKKLPRHKMCTGMIMDNLARALIAKEFGAIPDRVLADPPILSGIQWHTSSLRDVGDRQQDAPMSHTWRKELDYWMNQKAKEAGAEIWDETLVTDVTEESDGITLKIMRFSEQQEIRARFVVGADGSPSTTRTRLFPSLNVHYYGIYVECHLGALNLDRRYWHVFVRSPTITPRLSHDWFDVIHKGNCFLIEATAVVRHAKEVMSLAKQILVEKWGLDPKSKPLWTGGTVGAVLHDEFLSREFLPAKGNVLLVGDAAGLAPLGSIGMALKSGLMASSAILKAVNTSKEAAFIYLIMLQPVREVLKTVATMAATNQVGSKKLLDKLI